MADSKVSALGALTGSTVSTQVDVLPIVSTSATTTKKLTVQGLFDSVQGLAALTSSNVSQVDSVTLFSVSNAATRIVTVSNILATLSVPGIATQAQQETGTVTSAAVTPGRQQFHPSACKAWAMFSGTTINAGYNVASITSGGTGIKTVNFTTAFSGTAYCVIGSSINRIVIIASQATGSVTLNANDYAGVADEPTHWYVACYGDQ